MRFGRVRRFLTRDEELRADGDEGFWRPTKVLGSQHLEELTVEQKESWKLW